MDKPMLKYETSQILNQILDGEIELASSMMGSRGVTLSYYVRGRHSTVSIPYSWISTKKLSKLLDLIESMNP